MSLKVLHINTGDRRGGAEQFALDMAADMGGRLLVGKRHTQAPHAQQLPPSLMGRLSGWTDAALRKFFDRTLFADYGVLYPLHASWTKLQAHPWYQQADVVCLHNLHPDYFDLDALKAIAEEKPLVWVLHDMWVMTGGEGYVFDHQGFIEGDALTPYAHLYPFHNPIIDRRQEYLEKKKELLAALGERITLVPVSHWLGDCLQNAYVYHPDMRIRVIQNGVDTQVFRPLGERNWQRPRILFFNSENPYKGSELFAEVAPALQDRFELITIGKEVPGVARQTVYRFITERDKLNEIYNQADILVFPSRAENFPLTVLEAMATGMLVVGAETGGITEQLSEGLGVLFENGNAQALRKALEGVLDTPLADIREQGRLASQALRQSWGKERMLSAYRELFEEVAAERREPSMEKKQS